MGSGKGKSRRTRNNAAGDTWGWETVYAGVTVRSRVAGDVITHRAHRDEAPRWCLEVESRRRGKYMRRRVKLHVPWEGDIAVVMPGFVDALRGALNEYRGELRVKHWPFTVRVAGEDVKLICEVGWEGVRISAVKEEYKIADDKKYTLEFLTNLAEAEAWGILLLLDDVDKREARIARMMELRDKALRVDPDSVGRVSF